MTNNYQRKGATSNSKVGTEFESRVLSFFTDHIEIKIDKHKKIKIGINQTKEHEFDLANDKIIVECKSSSWTEGDNVPSAKLTTWCYAMYLFYLAPKEYKKLFFTDKKVNKRKKDSKSLLEYFIQTYEYLIPSDVTLVDFADSNDFDVYMYDENSKKHKKSEKDKSFTLLKSSQNLGEKNMENKTPTKQDFENALNFIFKFKEIFENAEYADIQSGNLHRLIGGYPAQNGNHRMPICCEVMKNAKQENDEVLSEPPSGQGATFTIRYKLPRT